MTLYFLRRVAYALPIALLVSLVCFLLVNIAPGDPIYSIVPPDTPPELVDQVRHDYGLDRAMPIRFALWLAHVAEGDLGRSLSSGRPVLSEIAAAMKNTAMLALVGGGAGIVLGCVLGGIAGAFIGGWIDRVAVGIAVAGVSVPHYWLGIVLVAVFSVTLKLLPALGVGPGDGATIALDWAHVRFLILPAATLAAIPLGVVTRNLRGLVAEILSQEFVLALHGKGLGRWRIVLHVVKNAAPTALAVIGLQLGYTMGGSILVETVFAWPGTGLLLNNAIFQRDIPVLQGTVLALSLLFVLFNLVVDLLQTALDPRIRRE